MTPMTAAIAALNLTMVIANIWLHFKNWRHLSQRLILRLKGQSMKATVNIDDFLDELHVLAHRYNVNATILVDDPNVKIYSVDMYGDQHCEADNPERVARFRVAASIIQRHADDLLETITRDGAKS